MDRGMGKSCTRISCEPRVFLEPGTNTWGLVIDFRWLNQHGVNSE